MPKRKIKEAVPRKKMSIKDMIILPAVIAIAVSVGFVITHFFPPPNVLGVCLKDRDLDPYNAYPIVQLFVNHKQYYFPNTLGKTVENGKECLHVIRADYVGNMLHVQYIRPIKLTLLDLMKIYSPDNKIINVVDNSTGKYMNKTVDLSKYDTQYSYYTVKGNFTKVRDTNNLPPFSNNFLGRIDLISK